MMRMFSVCLCLALFALGGCVEIDPTQSPDQPTVTQDQELRGGVPARRERCGDRHCAQGEVCCNASCGICTPPGYACTMQACERIRGGGRPDAECRNDADCVAFSNYCGGCACEAHGIREPYPLCAEGDVVSCFADPCMNQTAICRAGTCQLVSSF